jgi:hypothetical protein
MLELAGILPPASMTDCDAGSNAVKRPDFHGQPEKTAKIKIDRAKKPADSQRRACSGKNEA